jgi:beta-glucanase (GH16 family)
MGQVHSTQSKDAVKKQAVDHSTSVFSISWRSIFVQLLFVMIVANLFVSKSLAAPPAGYNLAWCDEFNQPAGSQPSTFWNFCLGNGGWGNGELENYTNSTNNCQIVSDPNATDGTALAIIAQSDYTSARINTYNNYSFQYGYIEARIQCTYGQGIWPTFWTLGNTFYSGAFNAYTETGDWPQCGENDIMENIGNDNASPATNVPGATWESTIDMAQHMPGHYGGSPLISYWSLPSPQVLHSAYHLYACEWTPGEMQYFVDGNLVATHTSGQVSAGQWVYDNGPAFILFNVAVGGGYPGSPDGSTSFPQTLLVDYVRVYQLPTPTPIVCSTWRVNAGGLSYTDGNNNVWAADENYSGGTPYTVTPTPTITSTTDPTLYQSMRYGNPFTYTFNVPAGSYQITLKFAELYWTGSGQRVFNVSVNGTQVLTNFDVFSAAGAKDKAIDEVFNNISPNSNGQIILQFGPSSADNAMVSAIQIIPQPGVPTSTPVNTASSTSTTTATSTQTTTNTATNTETNSSTNTSTNTPTKTLTNTATNTSTQTFVSSCTFTKTFTNTSTASTTSTASMTPSRTFSATASFTATLTPTATNTAVNTPTTTGTISPTFTNTASNTASPTATNTTTPSATAAHTPSSMFTATPSASSTPTLTVTNSVTNTETFTPTITPTYTFTNTSVYTATFVKTLTPTFTLTATNTYTREFTALPTITQSFTPTHSPTAPESLTPSPVFSPTATHTGTSMPLIFFTATPIPVIYPNPVTTGDWVHLGVSFSVLQKHVDVKLFTAAFRKLNEWDYTDLPSGTWTPYLEMKDSEGKSLANGLYYFVVMTSQGHSIIKVLILK